MPNALADKPSVVQAPSNLFEGGSRQTERAEIFAIPFQGQVIVYAPLKRLAFLGNTALARVIHESMQGPKPEHASDDLRQAIDFIDKSNILAPDPALPGPASQEHYLPGGTTLFLTNRCNLRCVYCYADAGSEKALDMPLDLALRAVDLVYQNAKERKLPCFEVGFHGGGEPTLNWEVMKSVILTAEKKALRPSISMSTNGCFGKEKLDFICEHFNGLSLSFDGPPEIQNRQRPQKDGSPSFKIVMQSINTFDRKGFPYGIRVTAMPSTLRSLPGIVGFLCKHTNVKQIQIEPAFARGRGQAVAVGGADVDRFIEYFKEAFEIAAAQAVALFYSGARLEGLTRRFCTAPHESLVLLPSGEISTCFEVHHVRHPLASSLIIGRLDRDGLYLVSDRWQGLMARCGDTIPFCRDCFCKYHCAGDCLGKTYSAGSKGAFKPSLRCRINRELTAYLLGKKIAAFNGVWCGAVQQ